MRPLDARKQTVEGGKTRANEGEIHARHITSIFGNILGYPGFDQTKMARNDGLQTIYNRVLRNLQGILNTIYNTRLVCVIRYIY